jgi:hypothetical protein
MRPTVLRALLLLSVSLSGCKLIDTDLVQFFGCGEGGSCPGSLVCCGDSMCRPSCGSGGGTATGGGGGTAGGTGGGTNTGGGGGGGGGALDSGVTCGPLTCPNGCCDGNTCVPGQSGEKCGRAGGACNACPGSEACVDGACGGCLQTCTTGCCSGSTCAPRGVDTCGANASACSTCGITADTCTGSGQCECGNGSACALGQRCTGGACVCDATSCPDGCCTSSGACLRPGQQSGSQCGLNGIACAGCDEPPAATCANPSDRVAYRAPGSCAAGTCAYITQTFMCAFGCADGSCVNDLCQGCLVPPSAVCVGNVRRSYESPGTCGTSGCTYSQVDTTCVFGCNGGACNPDPCAGVFCEQPPAARCNGNTRISYASPGTCSLGSCTYTESQTTCQFGCDGVTGQCTGDPCMGVSCTTPPVATCNGSVRRSYVSPGSCALGSCTYAQQDTTCASGCNAGQCLGDPCMGVTCTSPPAAICLNGTTRRTYGSSGTCALGSCNYAPADTSCPFGCANGSCIADPCSGVTCNTPPGPTCQGAQRRTYSATGTCSSGTCAYTPMDAPCNAPPPAVCVGSSRRTFASTGTCASGTCTYAPTDSVCANGCTGGTCNTDPCMGVSCTTPPPATCLNSTTRRTSGSPGTCGGGSCSYPTQDTVCNAPPAATCVNTSTLRSFSAAGTCSGGACNYTSSDTTCANGCSNGACMGDPCAGVTCNMPPGPDCSSANTRRTWAATGTCSGGTCTYAANNITCNTPPANFCASSTTLRSYTTAGTCSNGACGYTTTDSTCGFGCANGRCNPDPCGGVTCTAAPAADCANATTRRTYTAPGTCSGGSCSYPSSSVVCNAPPAPTCNGANTVRTFSTGGTCSGGTCSYAPIDTACNSPPAAICMGNVARSYANPGTCNSGQGTCSYAPADQTCSFGCSGGLCSDDPCAGVTCNSPPATVCADPYNLRIYNSSGTCSGGGCTYTSTTSSCPNGCVGGACQPCNSTTCPNGCCRNNFCEDSSYSCRTGGGACPLNACSGGRECIDGICLCPGEVPPVAPRGEVSALPICNFNVTSE